LLCSLYAVYVPLVIVPLLFALLISILLIELLIHRTGVIKRDCGLISEDHFVKLVKAFNSPSCRRYGLSNAGIEANLTASILDQLNR